MFKWGLVSLILILVDGRPMEDRQLASVLQEPVTSNICSSGHVRWPLCINCVSKMGMMIKSLSFATEVLCLVVFGILFNSEVRRKARSLFYAVLLIHTTIMSFTILSSNTVESAGLTSIRYLTVIWYIPGSFIGIGCWFEYFTRSAYHQHFAILAESLISLGAVVILYRFSSWLATRRKIYRSNMLLCSRYLDKREEILGQLGTMYAANGNKIEPRFIDRNGLSQELVHELVKLSSSLGVVHFELSPAPNNLVCYPRDAAELSIVLINMFGNEKIPNVIELLEALNGTQIVILLLKEKLAYFGPLILPNNVAASKVNVFRRLKYGGSLIAHIILGWYLMYLPKIMYSMITVVDCTRVPEIAAPEELGTKICGTFKEIPTAMEFYMLKGIAATVSMCISVGIPLVYIICSGYFTTAVYKPRQLLRPMEKHRFNKWGVSSAKMIRWAGHLTIGYFLIIHMVVTVAAIAIRIYSGKPTISTLAIQAYIIVMCVLLGGSGFGVKRTTFLYGHGRFVYMTVIGAAIVQSVLLRMFLSAKDKSATKTAFLVVCYLNAISVCIVCIAILLYSFGFNLSVRSLASSRKQESKRLVGRWAQFGCRAVYKFFSERYGNKLVYNSRADALQPQSFVKSIFNESGIKNANEILALYVHGIELLGNGVLRFYHHRTSTQLLCRWAFDIVSMYRMQCDSTQLLQQLTAALNAQRDSPADRTDAGVPQEFVERSTSAAEVIPGNESNLVNRYVNKTLRYVELNQGSSIDTHYVNNVFLTMLNPFAEDLELSYQGYAYSDLLVKHQAVNLAAKYADEKTFGSADISLQEFALAMRHIASIRPFFVDELIISYYGVFQTHLRGIHTCKVLTTTIDNEINEEVRKSNARGTLTTSEVALEYFNKMASYRKKSTEYEELLQRLFQEQISLFGEDQRGDFLENLLCGELQRLILMKGLPLNLKQCAEQLGVDLVKQREAIDPQISSANSSDFTILVGMGDENLSRESIESPQPISDSSSIETLSLNSNKQPEKLETFEYIPTGKVCTPNEIIEYVKRSRDESKLQALYQQYAKEAQSIYNIRPEREYDPSVDPDPSYYASTIGTDSALDWFFNLDPKFIQDAIADIQATIGNEDHEMAFLLEDTVPINFE